MRPFDGFLSARDGASRYWVAGLAGLSLLTAATGAVGGETVIKIGVLTDMSSVYASSTGMGSVEAVRMAVTEFGGSVNGKPVEVVFADHLNKPDVASAIAREWFDVENVDVIVDLPNSAVDFAVMDIAKPRNKPLLITSGANPDITDKDCTPLTMQWTYDSRQIAASMARSIADLGAKQWFMIMPNYVFGDFLLADFEKEIQGLGGTVSGIARPPLTTTDFSSFLLQAPGGTDVIVLAAAGIVNSIKQANEFGLMRDGKTIAAITMTETDVAAIGLDVAHGVVTTVPFFPDRTSETAAWSAKFKNAAGALPSYSQAATYSAVKHYLQAIKDTGTDDPAPVVRKMKDTQVDDIFAQGAQLREDGLLVHDWYLRKVKSLEESQGADDMFALLSTIKGEQVVRPLSESQCPLVKGK